MRINEVTYGKLKTPLKKALPEESNISQDRDPAASNSQNLRPF